MLRQLGSLNNRGEIDLNLLNTNLGHIAGIQGLPISDLPADVVVDGYTITINAPVGPPIWNLEPPKTAIKKPATIAV